MAIRYRTEILADEYREATPYRGKTIRLEATNGKNTTEVIALAEDGTLRFVRHNPFSRVCGPPDRCEYDFSVPASVFLRGESFHRWTTHLCGGPVEIDMGPKDKQKLTARLNLN